MISTALMVFQALQSLDCTGLTISFRDDPGHGYIMILSRNNQNTSYTFKANEAPESIRFNTYAAFKTLLRAERPLENKN